MDDGSAEAESRAAAAGPWEADRVPAEAPRDPSVPEHAGDQIRLVLPAEPDYGRIARVAASSLALRLGLSFTEIEDLRIAVDETIILLLRPEGSGGDISIEFTIEPHALVIDATTTAGEGQTWLNAGARQRFDEIVAETVDVHEVDEQSAHVHLVKRF